MGARQTVELQPCHNMGGNQKWTMIAAGRIQITNDMCITASAGADADGQAVRLQSCYGDDAQQAWTWCDDTHRIRLRSSGLCLSASFGHQPVPQTRRCDGSTEQQWQIRPTRL